MANAFTRRTKSAWGEGGQLKEEILDAAQRRLRDVDRESDLSLRAVARDVGIAAPSIYLHFADRTELVNAIAERVYLQVVDAMRQAHAAAPSDDPIAGIRAMAHRYCSYIAEDKATQRIMFNLQRRPELEQLERDHPIAVIHDAWRSAALALHPEQTESSAGATALMLWISLHGLTNLAVAFPSEVSGDKIDVVVENLLARILQP